MNERKNIFLSLAKILIFLAKFLFLLVVLFLSLFFIIKNSPLILEEKLITVLNAEKNPEIFYELKNIKTITKPISEISELKITRTLRDLFLAKKISFLDNNGNSKILVLKNYALSAEAAQEKNQLLIKEMQEHLKQRNLAIKEELINRAEDKYKLAQKNLESIRFELEKLELSKSSDNKTKRQIQQSIITALKTELVRIETQIAQLRAISPDSHQLNALKIRQKNLDNELEQRNKKYIDEPVEPEELNLKNKLKMQEEIAEKAFKEAFLEKSQIELEIKNRILEIKILN